MNWLILIALMFLQTNDVKAASENVDFDKSKWITVSFSKIPPNQVEFQANGIKVKVDKSASPLVYKFSSPRVIEKLTVSAEITGEKSKESGAFDEDSILRVGLVGVGTKRLNRLQRLIAASWVKELFKLVPSDLGLDRIYFYNVTNREEVLGKSRTHPKSDLMLENVVNLVSKPGPFLMEAKISPPTNTAALWISIDGDDSKSNYEVTLKKISFE